MTDLPSSCLTQAPAFTYVGVDVFGPWSAAARRTRGGQANSKRWAVLFTCLGTRAVHIEVIEEMTSSSFINALRRVISIRGKVLEFRSDRGSNFIGATDDLQIDTINVEDGPISNVMFNKGVTWVFNPHHSSHMGGAWERMMGVTRRILDSMITEVFPKNLTHEVLTTFMAEVSAIINARPIVPISTDPESPQILSTSALLNLKLDQVTETTDWNIQDFYRYQWRRAMSETFWKKWRSEYLQTLQKRRKWTTDHPNLQNGDVILLKEKSFHRNEWPMGVIVNSIPSSDSRVRKATVRILKDGTLKDYVRPISEIVLLYSPLDKKIE